MTSTTSTLMRELDHRSSNGIDVRLMWSESDGRVHVAVTDNKTGEAFTVDVREGESAAKVFQHLELAKQVLWPELRVELVSVTEQWAQYAVAGPRARDVLQAIVDPTHDISNEALLARGRLTVGFTADG